MHVLSVGLQQFVDYLLLVYAEAALTWKIHVKHKHKTVKVKNYTRAQSLQIKT